MERIRSDRNLCGIIRGALYFADIASSFKLTITDGRIVIERAEGNESDPAPAFEIEDDGVYSAYEYILDNAADDDLLNVYETMTGEMMERGFVARVEE